MNTGQTVYEQLQEIQDKIGDKTLSCGCIIKPLYYIQEQEPAMFLKTVTKYEDEGHPYLYIMVDRKIQGSDLVLFDDKEIIGHPVMIGDVLDYFQSNSLLGECIDLLGIWNNKRKPINDQSPETIKAIWEIICK